MQYNKITELKNKLPLGGKLEIIKRTKLNFRTVDNILNGKPARMANVIKVIKTAEDVVNEFTEITQKA
jgi:hypothetical protein